MATHDDEMHELNLEADYIDQKPAAAAAPPPPERVPSRHSDPDAEAMVIDSLRQQIQDLIAQVSQLNGKLVKSYDRVSDLEDELHVASSSLRNSTVKIGQLELERTEHISALSTGLLVERSHVTSELTRLMEKATEEAAKRGQAESARAEIEKDLDDLSAGLFDQANRMVAEARLARARSERKAGETEQALKGAEEIVGVLQAQMQALSAEKEEADKRVQEMEVTMGKGKWIAHHAPPSKITKMRLLSIHSPYQEYLQFILHLRGMRPSTQQPPAMSTLMSQPLLARFVAEDSDPTIRLDLAPSLNWLTRRSVLSAIHVGQLTIEPMSTSTLLEELAQAAAAGNSHPPSHVNCALCGGLIIEQPQPTSPTRPSTHPIPGSRTVSQQGSWSSAFMKSSIVQTISTATPNNLTSAFSSHNSRSVSRAPLEVPTQVYIFRLDATSSSGLPVSIPLSNQQQNGQNRPTIYPLCASGWCLTRLRSTCTLWAFVRMSIVEKIWEEPLPPVNGEAKLNGHGDRSPTYEPKPPDTPTKRARMGLGSLWGSMSRGLSRGGDEKEKEPTTPPAKAASEKRFIAPPLSPRRLPPPPVHPSIAPAGPQTPPALPPRHAAHANTSPSATAPPPPLPKRNRPKPETSEAQANGIQEHSEPQQLDVLAPPELNRNDSEDHDGFATPDGGLTPASEDLPPSPATIPLPLSAPGTPMQANFTDATEKPPTEPEPEPAPAPVAPQPPATPPPASVAQHAVQPDVKPPSRTGSPAPPPLPRRAAARARPVSTTVTPAAPVPPAPSAEPPAPVVPAVVEPLAQEGKVDTENGVSAQKDSLVSDTKTDEHHPEVNGDHTKDETEPKAEVEAQPQVEVEAEAVAVTEEKIEPVEDVGSEPEPPSYTASAAASSIELKHALNGEIVEEPEQEQEEPEPEIDPLIHVGDSTWEERTWKELVRLREDMFWARVGGVR